MQMVLKATPKRSIGESSATGSAAEIVCNEPDRRIGQVQSNPLKMLPLPRVHDVGLFLFIARAISLPNGHKAMVLIKAASSLVPLKCPEAQSIKSILCDP